jgi:hypothetical protein
MLGRERRAGVAEDPAHPGGRDYRRFSARPGRWIASGTQALPKAQRIPGGRDYRRFSATAGNAARFDEAQASGVSADERRLRAARCPC